MTPRKCQNVIISTSNNIRLWPHVLPINSQRTFLRKGHYIRIMLISFQVSNFERSIDRIFICKFSLWIYDFVHWSVRMNLYAFFEIVGSFVMIEPICINTKGVNDAFQTIQMKKCVLLLTVHMSVSLSIKLSQQRFVPNVTIIITVDQYYEKKTPFI